MGERLKIIIDKLFMTINSFAPTIGFSSDTIYNIIKGKTKISRKLMKNIFTKYPEVNPDFLLLGQGEPLIQQKFVLISAEKEKINNSEIYIRHIKLLEEKIQLLQNEIELLKIERNKLSEGEDKPRLSG